MTPQEELAAIRKSQEKSLTPLEELRQLRASQSRGSSLGMARPKSFEELSSSSTGKDLGNFDYTTGAKGGIRAALSFMETPQEKENLLRQKVGESGFTKDSKGRLAN
jgi:hypothetical protein